MSVPEFGDSPVDMWDETGTVRISGTPDSPWVIELEPDFKLNYDADAMSMRVQRMANDVLMAARVSESRAASESARSALERSLNSQTQGSSAASRIARLHHSVLAAQATVREMQSQAPDSRVFEGGRPTACYAQVRSGLVTLVAVEPRFFARESAPTVGGELTAAIHEALSQTREAIHGGEPPLMLPAPGGPS